LRSDEHREAGAQQVLVVHQHDADGAHRRSSSAGTRPRVAPGAAPAPWRGNRARTANPEPSNPASTVPEYSATRSFIPSIPDPGRSASGVGPLPLTAP